MHVLVINSGSSSMKFSIFETEVRAPATQPECLLKGEISGIGSEGTTLLLHERGAAEGSEAPRPVHAKTPEAAMSMVLEAIRGQQASGGLQVRVDAVGYRVVHPGAKLKDHQRITPEVLDDLNAAAAFAPLHDPAVLPVIKAGMEHFPQVSHYACFDTVFHRTMPPEATTYPLPERFRAQGVQRYGFHGLSCESVVRTLRLQEGGCPRRMVIAHLGSGCSVTAVRDGRSIDTSMGLTPTGGVVMGTRPGDLDPGVVLYLLRQSSDGQRNGVDEVESMLNHTSGMVALSGEANDMKRVRASAAEGSHRSVLALAVFTRSVRKAIGSYCWLMGGLDAVVFTGGIGEHDRMTRAETLADLHALGISLDPDRNSEDKQGFRRVSRDSSPAVVYVIPAEEDLVIAEHVDRMSRATRSTT